MPEERPQARCLHHVPGGPAVCGPCAYALLVQAGVNQASLSPQQLADWQRYLQVAQVQGRQDLAAISGGHAAGQTSRGDRAVANRLIGSSRPDQLPSSYPYPTSIDEDVAASLAAPAGPAAHAPNHNMQSRQNANMQRSLPARIGSGHEMPAKEQPNNPRR